MTFVSQTCSAANSSCLPSEALPVTSASTSRPRTTVLAKAINSTNTTEVDRDQRVSLVIRSGLTTSSGTNSNNSSAGNTRRGPSSRRLGSTPCSRIVTRTAAAAGSRASPRRSSLIV